MYKVLLADDVRLELEIEKTFFQRSGFKVLTAPDGPKALAIALTESPDLVILDQVMPEMNGSDVCKLLKVKKETQQIPVIITSSIDRPEVRETCRAAGADTFVPKSAGREALLQVAAQILHVSQRRSTRITVFYTVQDIVGGKESLGKGVVLSEGGMGLETARRYDPGSTLRLRFMLQGEKQEHKAITRVVRVSERAGGGSFHLALEFLELSEGDRKRLNQYLDRPLVPR